MKRQRAKRDVVRFDGVPFQNVGFAVGNLRIIRTQLSGNFQCGRLPIYRIDTQGATKTLAMYRVQWPPIVEYRQILSPDRRRAICRPV